MTKAAPSTGVSGAAVKAVALGLLAGVGAFLYKLSGASAPPSVGSQTSPSTEPSPAKDAAPAPPLSARRLRVLADLGRLLRITADKPDGVPARYPDEKFREIAPGYDSKKDDSGEIVQTDHGVVLPKGFTTCGYLPCAVGRMQGLEKEITQCGLEAMRTLAKKWGAWVEPGEGRLPRPGDPYGIDQAQGGPLIVHVGIVGEAKADGSWTTMDAGQGTKLNQEAKVVHRKYNAEKNTISGPEGKGGERKLAGWVDIDKVPPLAAA